MKTIKIIFSCIATLFLFSNFHCGKSGDAIFIDSELKLRVNVINDKETIKLGETVRLEITIPEQITITNKTTGITTTEVIHSIDPYYSFFQLVFSKQNQIENKREDVSSDQVVLVKGKDKYPVGKVAQESWIFSQTKPYQVIIEFTPKERGLYYMDFTGQSIKFVFNGNREALLRCQFFDYQKSHLALLNDPLGENWWLKYDYENYLNIYAFRVE